MPADIIGLILVFIALFALALQRLYSSVPVKELKRLAARGEHLAAILYRPVAYGTSLRVLLWLIAGICLPVGFLLLAQNLPITASLLIMMAALAIGAIWLPNQQLSLRSARIAAWAAPSLEWVLHHTHRPLNILAEHINGRRTLTSHSGLYEKDDLQTLLAQQQVQEDNRIDPSEIELMQRALHFSDTKAAEIAIPRKDAPMLSTSDALGPILFDELHKSGQQFFIVYRSKPDNVVGMLALKDAKHSKKGGTVADIMMTDLCFVGEDFSLPQIARAFVATGQQVAVVINKFEEFVGIISFNRLMEFLFAAQMTEQPAVQYEDRAAVASYKAPMAVTEQPANIPEEEITSSPEISEVVE
jgi:CBS domain containing-hemolysin-like protein